MPTRVPFDYALIRVVPRVERGEFLNVGVLVYCLKRDFLAARTLVQPERLRALDPQIDLPQVKGHLEALERVAAGDPEGGPIARLPQKERFHWLVAPRSTLVQVSPVHPGLCLSPEAALERLVDGMVRVPEAVAREASEAGEE